MAVETGTGSATGEKLTEEQKELLVRAKKPVDRADKFRLVFLFIAVVALVFIFFGNKAWEGILWYDTIVQRLYQFLLWDIVCMLISTFVKLFYVAKYNQVVKQIRLP